jgi:hypothetical protein
MSPGEPRLEIHHVAADLAMSLGMDAWSWDDVYYLGGNVRGVSVLRLRLVRVRDEDIAIDVCAQTDELERWDSVAVFPVDRGLSQRDVLDTLTGIGLAMRTRLHHLST